MTLHKVRIEFFRHHRRYLPDQLYSFEEWPDETRDTDISDLHEAGFLVHPEEDSLLSSERDAESDPPAEEAVSLDLPLHKHESGDALDSGAHI